MISEADLLAELIRLHNQDRWGGALPVSAGRMRNALLKVGWIERFQHSNVKRTRWRVSDAGRRRLVDVPGSGIIRSPLLE